VARAVLFAGHSPRTQKRTRTQKHTHTHARAHGHTRAHAHEHEHEHEHEHAHEHEHEYAHTHLFSESSSRLQMRIDTAEGVVLMSPPNSDVEEARSGSAIRVGDAAAAASLRCSDSKFVPSLGSARVSGVLCSERAVSPLLNTRLSTSAGIAATLLITSPIDGSFERGRGDDLVDDDATTEVFGIGDTIGEGPTRALSRGREKGSGFGGGGGGPGTDCAWSPTSSS